MKTVDKFPKAFKETRGQQPCGIEELKSELGIIQTTKSTITREEYENKKVVMVRKCVDSLLGKLNI